VKHSLTFITCVIVSLWGINLLAEQPHPLEQVTVQQGQLQGAVKDGTVMYKGVPFAQPPIGDLRWRAPQTALQWQGIRQATEYAPAPMQAGQPVGGVSEDSLYLNIWTEAQSADEKRPVLVWIYGGGFSFGASSDPLFEGTPLAKKGVTVVSIAYRVGQLGFLAHPQLSAENPHKVSGNYGLLDQIAALKWIKNNIAAFGGDPNNVTIAGESAGGISVSMLAASPLATGLFHKAISQSGGSFGPVGTPNYPGENMIPLAVAEQQGADYVKQFNHASIEQLRKLPAERFIPQGWSLPGGWPIVDGYVVPDDQFTLYEQGKFNDVPVLIGYNSDEGASFVRDSDAKEFVAGIKKRFGPFAPSLMDAYSISDERITRSARDLIRDAAFGWHTWSWARLQAHKGQAPVYLYFFDQHANHAKDSEQFGYGSPHGQEIAYMFNNLDLDNPATSATDVAISEAMSSYWSNFAKQGNPNQKGLTHWPAFTSTAEKVMLFQQQPKVADVPDEQALKVLDQYFAWRRNPGAKAPKAAAEQ